MPRRTKIVCTIGPAVDSRESLAKLIAAGMNVARLNCSHGDWETRAKWIRAIRELSPPLSPIGILVDLQGPKIRIGDLPSGSLELAPGQSLTVGPDPGCAVPINQPEILKEMGTGDRLLLGDGNVELKLKRRVGSSLSPGGRGPVNEENWGEGESASFEAVAVTGGTIRSRQGLTLVDKVFQIPAFTERDREDLRRACELGVDFVALSYVHNAEELEQARAMIRELGCPARLCAKIETRAALKHLDAILASADMAMVARGDLGLQMNLEDVPMAQKEIILKSNRLGKPVITATQMLESMVQAPRPTRAEVADIANAILDGTDALMLSGETATGSYPVACVETMARIAAKAESMLDHEEVLSRQTMKEAGRMGTTHAIARAVVRLAESINPKAILTTTTSGQTACLVSKYRPRAPVLCATWNHATHRQMSVVWGVETIYVDLPENTDEIVHNAMEGFKRHKRLKEKDHVIVTAGVPAGTPGHTNLILHEVVK